MTTTLSTYEGLTAISSMKARMDAVDMREIMLEISAAPKNQRVRLMVQISERTGKGFGTVRNAYYRWEKQGDVALVDRRRQRQLTAENPWLPAYMTYIENDLNTAKNGYRQMMADFRAGKPMPGMIGTWIDVWKRERPGEPVPAECPLDWTPHGATYENLQAIAKSNPNYYFAIASNRRGRKAASPYVLPVLTTRAGLAVGAKYEFDDVWHNTDVMVGAKACQMLEFAGYDVASAYKAMSVMKPRFQRADGVRDNLKEQQFRFALASLLCRTGFHKGGTELVVEHGTTAIRDRVEKQIKAIPGVGDLIRFSRSGILSEQVHAGLFIGNGGGNFKMKALCEGAHNILHNRTASLIGSRGRDAERLHESQAALVKYEERLMAAAAKLPPQFALKLEAGLLSVEEYQAAFCQIEASLMDDPEHRLEGWDANWVEEYRLNEQPNDWRPWSEVEKLYGGDEGDRLEAFAIAKLVSRNAALKRRRPMSRREVWAAGQGDLIRVDDWYLPSFMDFEKDAIELKVRPNGLMGFRNELLYGRDEVLFRANVRDFYGYQTSLAPDRKYWAFFNPAMPEKIWLVDKADGHTLGTCPLFSRAPAYDRHAIEIALGDQAHDLATKVLPIRGRHQAEAEDRARRMANNLRVMKAAEKSGDEPVMMGSTEPLELAELAGSTPTADEDAGTGASWDDVMIP